MRTCLPSEFIHVLEAAEFSKNFQAFVENYVKENNVFECRFRKLGHIQPSNCARNLPCTNQICLHGQFPQRDNLTRFAFEGKLIDI